MLKPLSQARLSARPYFKIRRATAGKPFFIILLSDEPIVAREHFFEGRTIPCMSPDPCLSCEANVGVRSSVYSFACEEQCTDTFIIHIPEAAGRVLQQVPLADTKTYRGLRIRLVRKGSQDNASVHVSFGGYYTEKLEFCPQAGSLESALKRIWGIETLVK